MKTMIQQLTRIRPGVVRFAFSMLALLGLVLVSTSAQAQETIRFSRPGPIRLTVSVNTTNTGVVTNLVNVGGTVTSGITLSVSNLPAGCGYDMATNGVSVGTTVVITNDVALSVTVKSTNVVESEYTFYVTATGDATNQFPYTLQSCYVWNTNILAPAAGHLANFATASSWKDGVGPGATSLHDIFFGTSGSQTNVDSSGIPATNINITANTQVGSIRVGVGTEPDLGASRSQHILIAGNTTLSVVSNRGFTVLRDYITEYASGDRRSKLHISGGGNGARLLVTNANANFALLMDSGTSGENVINMTNLQTFEVNVRRFGLGDYQLYPNYRAMNLGSNSSDGLGGIPRKFMTTVILARSNFITATYQSPDNYANDTTREYGIRWLNSEMSGNGSSENNQLHFGFTNIIKSDAVCFVGGNMASGNSGFARFRAGQNNNSAIFRSAGGGRMSLFTISDGGGTNEERSNIKANIDFWGNQSANNIDIVTTNFYIARDRAWIQSSNTVNYAGSFTMGKGTNDTINTILGYQEHQVRLNDVLQAGKQLGYCQGTVIITNGGVFKVANQLTLGYTADTNAVGVAELYNNFGRVSVNNGGQLIVNKVVVDGGPRNYSHTEGNDRNDSISLNEATLVLTNTIGAAPGQPLNSYSTTKSTNTWHVGVDKTNLVCRTLSTPGTAASVIKVASISGVTTLPATLPIISYETASSPYLQADMTGNGTTNGYLLNNTANSTINLYLTTNAPKTLLWTGSQDNNWDYATKNWVLVGGSGPTNFAIGDIVIFDDSSTVTNVNVSGEVVPGQSGAGVTVSNIVRQYTFSGGTVAGTSLLLKRGSGQAVFTCTKQGPVTMLEGSMNVGSGGTIGLLTLASNTFVNVSGAINGGLTSTGAVQVVSGGTVDGPINIAAGWVNNDGTISSSPGSIVLNQLNPLLLTNSASGIINQWGAQWTLGTNSVLCNMGTINNLQNRLNVAGFMYGTGTVADPDGTGGGGGPFPAGIDGRLEVRPGTATMLSPGATPFGSIGTMTVNTRFDLSGVDNSGGWATMLVEVDKSNPQTNDQVLTYFFSNMAGKLIVSNINLSMPFAAGDAFQVIKSSNPIGPDNKAGEGPQIEPFIPGPGLVWDLSDFRTNGWIKVTSNALVWAGSVNSTWDTGITANWAGGSTYSNLVGAKFDDTAVNFTVNIATNVFPAGFATNTPLAGSNVPSIFPGVIVSGSSNYTFTGDKGIVGWGGLYKTGSGTLTFLNQTNDYKESTIIDGGTMVVSLFPAKGNASPLGSPGSTPGNSAPRTSERLVIGNNATLRYIGNTTNSDRGLFIYPGGATLEIASNAANLLLTGDPIRGPGLNLTKTGPGTLSLFNGASGANTYADLNVNNGQVRLSVSSGTGNINLAAGTTLGLTNNINLANRVNANGGAAIDNTNTSVLNVLAGAGNLSVTNPGIAMLVFNDTLTNYSGDFTFVGVGTNRFNNATNTSNCRGNAGSVFNLGVGRLEANSGSPVTYDLGGLSGSAGSVLAGSFSPATFSIGAKGVDTTFAGSIVDNGSTASVIKTGSGKLLLNGVNTYTGTTTVSGGTLGGTGSIASALTVSAGTLSPGASVGTFTVSNSATLGGTTLMELSPAGADLLRVTGSLTGGGALVVTNIGGTLTNGTVFTLFSQSVSNFTSTTLPAGYSWTDNLAVNGSITVASGGISLVNTTPTNIVSSVSGGVLTLTWPSDHIGWTLQTQTNALSVGLVPATNAWFPVTGSSTTNSVSATIDQTPRTIFYRLVYP